MHQKQESKVNFPNDEVINFPNDEVINFPKIKSPFIREKINGRYIVTPQIEEGAEELIFYHPDGRMAKIMRSMFDWYEGGGT